MTDRPSSDELFVGPTTCHIQTASNRFGSHAAEDIMSFVYEGPNAINGMGFDEDDDDEDDEFDESEDDGADGDDDNMDDALEFGDGVGDPHHSATGAAGTHADDVEYIDGHQSFPRLARCRANLTVLSQQFNLYFAAYQDKIHVFRPQKAPQILPPPSLILHPPRSRISKTVGGALDKGFGHQINYLIIGELGHFEVLLMCYDDGDVIAYYTHLIAHSVEQAASSGPLLFPFSRAANPKPFFHDNVGASAWGLAIHKKSRLLAVSCNKHDVTIFASAMNPLRRRPSEFLGDPTPDDQSPKVWSGQSALELEKHFQSRTRTWRIVLPLGPEANNIPSIAFIDDEGGHADKIVAVDIHGNTWIVNIWQIGSCPVLYLPTPSRGVNDQRYMGWTVLILPDSSFREAQSDEAAMGLYPMEIVGPRRPQPDMGRIDVWLDTTRSLFHIKDNAVDPQVFLGTRHGQTYFLNQPQSSPDLPQTYALPAPPLQGLPGVINISEPFNFSDDEDSSSSECSGAEDDPPDAHSGRHWGALTDALRKTLIPAGSAIDLTQEDVTGFHLARTIVPGLGQTPPSSDLDNFFRFLASSHLRKNLTRPTSYAKANLPSHLTKHFSILRTTASDVELQSLEPGTASTLCKDVIVPPLRRGSFPWDMHPHLCERISMALHVPELGIVALGSLCGRVAILSLTRPPSSRIAGTRVKRSFKIECVLPRREEDHHRPCATLHGISISPVHDHRAGELRLYRPAHKPRRYRLILHYLDHTILMYDISRGSPEEDLLIF